MRTRSRSILAGLAAATLLLTGCTAGSTRPVGDGPAPGATSAVGSTAAGTTPSAPPVVRVTPGAAARDVNPAEPVSIAVAEGTIASVVLTAADGTAVAGEQTPDRSAWTSTDPLAYATDYTVRTVATGADGRSHLSDSTFRTLTPTATVFPAIGPLEGTTVGIAMPVRVYLDAPATDRAEVQKHLTVTSTPPQEGSWSWLSDTEVHWRPKAYWQAGTQVTVRTDLLGVDFGAGAYGQLDRTVSFTVGPAHRSVANANTHQMQVFDGGRLIRTMPVSMGKGGEFYTRSGPHVVIDKNREKVMDSTTYGLALDAGGYVTKVDYATRISNNGEFVHSAPWSVPDQGVRNVSHGCINLSPDNAAWFFGFAQVGDVVEVVGTPVFLGPADGDIYDWAVPWADWVAGSAL